MATVACFPLHFFFTSDMKFVISWYFQLLLMYSYDYSTRGTFYIPIQLNHLAQKTWLGEWFVTHAYLFYVSMLFSVQSILLILRAAVNKVLA